MDADQVSFNSLFWSSVDESDFNYNFNLNSIWFQIDSVTQRLK